MEQLGSKRLLHYDFAHPHTLYAANERLFGEQHLPYYDLKNTRYLLSFGADFLGSWISPVHHSLGYGHSRQGRPGVRGRFVQIEPRMSLSGAAADEWIAARPGTEGLLALGLAHRIVSDGHYRGADRDDWADASVALLDRASGERDRCSRRARSRGLPTASRKRNRALRSAAAQRAITPTASTS